MGRLYVRGIEVCLSPPSLHAVAACLGPAPTSEPGLTLQLCCPGGPARPDPPLVMASHSLAYLGKPAPAPPPYTPQTLPVPSHHALPANSPLARWTAPPVMSFYSPTVLQALNPLVCCPACPDHLPVTPPCLSYCLADPNTPKFYVFWGHFLMNK